jgi:hypothetical protein
MVLAQQWVHMSYFPTTRLSSYNCEILEHTEVFKERTSGHGLCSICLSSLNPEVNTLNFYIIERFDKYIQSEIFSLSGKNSMHAHNHFYRGAKIAFRTLENIQNYWIYVY